MKCHVCGKRMKKTRCNYPYEESGLSGVVLGEMVVYVCPACGEEEVEIPVIECLHQAIADVLIQQNTPLSGPEIRFLRKEMRFKANVFASILRVNKVTLSKWENDVIKPSSAYDSLIRLFYLRFREEQTGKFRTGFKFEEILQRVSGERKPEPILIPREKWEECTGRRC